MVIMIIIIIIINLDDDNSFSCLVIMQKWLVPSQSCPDTMSFFSVNRSLRSLCADLLNPPSSQTPVKVWTFGKKFGHRLFPFMSHVNFVNSGNKVLEESLRRLYFQNLNKKVFKSVFHQHVFFYILFSGRFSLRTPLFSCMLGLLSSVYYLFIFHFSSSSSSSSSPMVWIEVLTKMSTSVTVIQNNSNLFI